MGFGVLGSKWVVQPEDVLCFSMIAFSMSTTVSGHVCSVCIW